MRKSWILGAASAAALSAAFAGSAFAQSETATTDAPADSSTRSSLSVGGSATGVLDPAGDADWFRIRLRSGRGYAISLAGDGDNALSDPMVRLLDSNGEEVGSNDDGPDGLNSLLIYGPERSGTFYIEARGFGEDAAGGYKLSVEERALPRDNAAASTRTRARINAGQTVQEVIAPPGDKDWYRIDLSAGETYRFSLSSNESAETPLGDPFLRVLNAEGEEVASDDDGGTGLNSYLEFSPSAGGRYFLEAGSFGDGGEGGYSLSAMAGDIPGSANTDVSIAADGEYREGTLSPAGDSDWYRLELEEGQTVRIGLTSGGVNGLGDPYLVIHDSAGAEVASDDDGGEGLNSWLEFTAAAAGAYYVEARGFGDDAQGSYVVSVLGGEVGNDAGSAEPLTIGDEGRVSVINPDSDQDWYSVYLVEGRAYRFNLTSEGDPALGDPMLTLYDETGKVVVSDDDGGTGFNSYIAFSPVTGGSYYAAVSAFGEGDAGSYRLSVSDTDVPGNEGTDERLNAADGDDREGAIELPGDLDFFAVDLEAGTRYVITLAGVGDHPLTDPFVALMKDGEQVGSNDDGGPGLDSRLVFTPRESGSYFIKASGNGGSVGRYKVAISH